MHKKRGFTLVEVLVVIAVATLVLAMVGGTLVFMATSSGKLIHKAEEITQTQAIEKYLRGLADNKPITVANEKRFTVDGKTYKYDLSDGVLKFYEDNHDDPLFEFKDTGLKSFNISTEQDDFINCQLEYGNNGGSYSFIIGIKE